MYKDINYKNVDRGNNGNKAIFCCKTKRERERERAQYTLSNDALYTKIYNEKKLQLKLKF